MKKILFIFILLFTSYTFSQEKDSDFENKDNKNPSLTISNVLALPNPFQDKTEISFESTIDQEVKFYVKSLLGKVVYNAKFDVSSGSNSIPFKRDSINNGLYIFTIQTNYEVISKRLVIN